MTPTAHDCAHRGHVWLEGSGANAHPYVRHRGRKSATVTVRCQHCGKHAKLQAHGAFTAPPGPHPVVHRIPPGVLKAMDRALGVDEGTTTQSTVPPKRPTTGPAPMRAE